MKNSINKKAVFLAFGLMLSYIFAYQTVAQESDVSIRFYDQDTNPTFYVDGKKIQWQDLTKEQQVKISGLRDNLEKAQAKLDANQAEWDKISDQMEQKAEEIEKEVSKLTTATISNDKKELNIHELSALMSELQQKVQLNEALISERGKELAELSQQIQPDSKTISEIEKHAKALETELAQIAASM